MSSDNIPLQDGKEEALNQAVKADETKVGLTPSEEANEPKKEKKTKERKDRAIETSGAEITFTSVFIGVLLAVLLTVVNVYLGLKTGVLVFASIPVTVIILNVYKNVFKKEAFLEGNIINAIVSAGEALSVGGIIALPIIFLWAREGKATLPSIAKIAFITFVGGVIGTLITVLLHRLVPAKNKKNPYPESEANIVLINSVKGDAVTPAEGQSFKPAVKKIGFIGIGALIAGGFKILTDLFRFFPSSVTKEPGFYKGASVGLNTAPAFLSIGFLCGFKISSLMFFGSIVSTLVIAPIISLFGSNMTGADLHSGMEIATMTASDIHTHYLLYIGAGALVVAGLINVANSLMCALPSKNAQSCTRIGACDLDYSGEKKGFGKTAYIVSGAVLAVMILVLAFVPAVSVGLLGALVIVLGGFIFSLLSIRIVALVGNRNNPIIATTMITMIATTALFKGFSKTGHDNMVKAIVVGTIISVLASLSGNFVQNVKTGAAFGSSKNKLKYAQLIGVTVSAVACALTLYLLHTAWGFGSPQVPAASAMVMKRLVEGIMTGTLSWHLIIFGGVLALGVQFVKLPSLPFALGLFLPFEITVCIFIGGIIREIVIKTKRFSAEEKSERIDKGTFLTSGMILGESLVVLVAAVFSILRINSTPVINYINFGEKLKINQDGIGLVLMFIFFILIVAAVFLLIFNPFKGKAEKGKQT